MLQKLTPGKNPPQEINVVIEIPAGSNIKYEIDEETLCLFVDRFLYTSMSYPFNYGFIPKTAGEDHDPLDVMVLSSLPVVPRSVLRAKPVGMLKMKDEEGIDTKILAVPIPKIDPVYGAIESVEEVAEITKQKIEHFFKHYKELEKNKWVETAGWDSKEAAEEKIRQAIQRFNK